MLLPKIRENIQYLSFWGGGLTLFHLAQLTSVAKKKGKKEKKTEILILKKKKRRGSV